MIHERCHVASFHQCDICGKRFRSKEKMKCHRSEIFLIIQIFFTQLNIFREMCLNALMPPKPKEIAGLITECAVH